MSFLKFRFATVAGTLLAMTAAVSPAGATAISCVNSNFDGFKAATVDAATTSSKSFSNVPGLTVNVTNTGSCVQIHLSADIRTPSTGAVQVRITIDDGTVVPDVVTLATPTGKADHRSAIFLISGVPVGSHIVHVQFRSVTGAPVKFTRPLMVAIFKTV
jgi:hypothetical protein